MTGATTTTGSSSSSSSTMSSNSSCDSSDSLASSSSPRPSSPSAPPPSSPRACSRPPFRRSRSGQNLSSSNLCGGGSTSSSSSNHHHQTSTAAAGAAGSPRAAASSPSMVRRRTAATPQASNSHAVHFLPPSSPSRRPPPLEDYEQVSLDDRRHRQRQRSMTMGDIDFGKSLTPTNTSSTKKQRLKRYPTTKHDPAALFALSSPFQQELEARWKAALAKRRELEKQESMGSQASAHQPLTRFAPFSVSDAPRAPPLNQADCLALLVDHVVPEALHTLLNSRTTRAQKKEAKALCLPGTRGHTSLLWAACWVAFGAAFAKTVLSAVSPAIIKDFGISKSVYGALAGLPAISNIIAGPLGGALIDRMGADRGCVFFALVVVAGSACVTLSLPTESVALLASSQIIMGVGKGSLTTAQKVFLKLACAPGEMSFYFALSFSLTHFGTFLAFFLSPLVAESSKAGYKASIWTSGAIAVGCLLCTLPLLGKLRHVEPFLRQGDGGGALRRLLGEESEGEEEGEGVVRGTEVVRRASDGTWASSDTGEEEEEEEREEDLLDLEESGQHGGTRREGGSSSSVPVAREVERGDEGKFDENEEEDDHTTAAALVFAAAHGALDPTPSGPSFLSSCWQQLLGCPSATYQALLVCFSDLCTWPFFFLLMTTLCFYAAFMPFETFAVDYLKTHLNFSSAHASLGASLLPALSVLLSPPMGALVDKELAPLSPARPASFFRRYLWPPGSTQLWAMLLTAMGLLSLLPFLTPTLGWVPGFTLVSMGYAFSCASLWTTIPYFVPTRSLGLALGVIHAVDDAGILAVQVGVGRLLDEGDRDGEGEDWEYEEKVLPLLVLFALLACLTTLPVMKALKTRITV